MTKISNSMQIVENARSAPLRRARVLALESFELALDVVDPFKLVKSKVFMDGSFLHVNGHLDDLRCFKNVYVIGGGKAGAPMVSAVEEILSDRITAGIVNVPYGNKVATHFVELNEASHPLPDEGGIKGTLRMSELAEQAGKDDLVICLLSGGGSSLMPLPRSDISLDSKRQITNGLLKCGATIKEINAVRKHLSAFKGGWLARKCYPATVLTLILSDVVGDALDSIASGPTVPDPTTFFDAHKVLEKYGLWENAPVSIRNLLFDGEKGAIEETPKKGDEAFERVSNIILGNNRCASIAICEYLKSKSLNTVLLTSALEGEAKHVGIVLSSIAKEVLESGNPVSKPAAIIAGGETTVTVGGEGLGGRNQELALSVALRIRGSHAITFSSFSTDGVDGPTNAAGAIVDGETIQQAEKLGIDPETYLARNDSNTFFSKIGGLIITGNTGTNVNDISLLIIS